ncbi:MAG: NAD(P)-dependent glycerol-3-phosphate dehydrogenase [Geothrix sp.]|uniref:NAD(P)H-dependent glycerol-3-phosphate dehydrogenase n=1 Tax=Geothrix sp. TaxID=1962974 RepID=UPI00183CF327|nr:NAD(P)H-dependent glycerol-3-phosphate dehydrogenase [Geothrix sp.]NWJ39447.1 NAD(P)-dependent glycerol-3-phosphate dehydrogenase [Geothrix sp.]WIL19328.1 MAG: NAD(P)-dependent glycerol-3-phosphate dehydrogenase [Geothrix sp.]
MAKADIGVFGSGAWGTALAMTWARKGAKVALWGPFEEEMAQMAATRRHLRLKDVEFPEGLQTSDNPTHAFEAPLWISAMPTQVSPEAWRGLLSRTPQRPELVVHVSKGILQSTHQTLSQALTGVFDVPVGALSGPSFADEVSLGVPTAIVLALPLTVSEERAKALQAQLASEKLRIYLSRDVLGTELCGALKNVLAIAAGLVDGLGLGYNARAALITRGLAEMSRLVEVLGGQPSTVMGLAGMGDLLLTATGPQSRNRTFGEKVGKGQSVEAARNALGGQVIEGMFTCEAALDLGREHGLELPIAAEVLRLLNGERPEEAVRRLMTRSLKSE